MSPLAAAAIAGGLLLLLSEQKGFEVMSEVIDAGRFAAALPGAFINYVPIILRVAEAQGVSPWMLAGIMWHESRAGAALTPPGPAGTGDFYPRSQKHSTFRFANPATGLPPDGKGWGRGLMQIDYGVYNSWVTQNAWWDPETIINFAAAELAKHMRFFEAPPGGPVTVDAWRLTGLTDATGKVLVKGWGPLYGLRDRGPYLDPRPLSGPALHEAALAAYNAGDSGVLQAVAAGLPPSAPTTGNAYGQNILTSIQSWGG